MTRPSACAVVVPAHDEQDTLPATLMSVRAAARHPALSGTEVRIVVVADACTDDTAAMAGSAGAIVLRNSFHNVGRSRAAGVDAARRLLSAHGEGLWIAATDADTLVPRRWLAHQLWLAGQGWDAVVGTVCLAPHPTLSTTTAARHDARYFAGRPPGPGAWDHPHVHGANLGVAVGPYLAAGGFPPLGHSEDRVLVTRLEAAGSRVLRTDACPVLTSARSTARAPHGLGALLATLAAR